MSRIYTTTADYRTHELEPALGTYTGEFDIDAIMAELIETGYVYYDEDEKGFRDDQDTGAGKIFWGIVSKHELGAQGMVDAINAAEPYGHPYEETDGIWQARWDRARDFEDQDRTEFYCNKIGGGDDSAGVVTSSGTILVPDAHDRAGDWGYDTTGNHPDDAWTNWLASNGEWCDTCGEAHTYEDLFDQTTPCTA